MKKIIFCGIFIGLVAGLYGQFSLAQGPSEHPQPPLYGCKCTQVEAESYYTCDCPQIQEKLNFCRRQAPPK